MINTFFIYICSILVVILTIPFLPVVLLGGQRAREIFLRNWARLTIVAFQSKVLLVGQENIPTSEEKKVLYLSNHASLLDIPVLWGWIDQSTAFIAKKDLLFVPVVGIWMKILGCVFLSRKPSRQELKKFQTVRARLEEGDRFFLFPEGTRSRTGKLGKFRSVKKMMDIEGLKVVPIYVTGTYEIVNPRAFSLKPGIIEIKVGPAATISDGNARAVLEDIHSWMQDEQRRQDS